jgi:siderophore synthetase component
MNLNGSSSTDPFPEPTLRQVRAWATAAGLSSPAFASLYRGALRKAMSNLVQALWRERLCPCRDIPDGLALGESGGLQAPAQTDLPFRRLRLTDWPRLRDGRGERTLRSAGAFLRALSTAVPDWTEDDLRHLRQDFHNSLANLVLNRALVPLRPGNAVALEPAPDGHQTFPFPGLRVGPSLSALVDCSPLNARPVRIPLVEVGTLLRIEAGGGVPAEDWMGTTTARALAALGNDGAVLPVHPWQLTSSAGLRALFDAGLARLLPVSLAAVPLASQRTCHLLETGCDLKLPVDAALTGEYRLLYRLNCENAVAVSSAIEALIAKEGLADTLGGQFDRTALFHPLEALSPTLSAIVRAPIAGYGATCIPAINLWTGPRLALARLRDRAHAERFFRRYCRVVLAGPLRLIGLGMATEPHLQNALIDFDAEGLPARLVLRDLDATVLDPARWRDPRTAPVPLPLAEGTWAHMPTFADGCRRTIYAAHFGHLGTVVDTVRDLFDLPLSHWMATIDDVWQDLAASAPVPLPFDALRRDRDAVRICLANRIRRDPGLRFTA